MLYLASTGSFFKNMYFLKKKTKNEEAKHVSHCKQLAQPEIVCLLLSFGFISQ